MKKILLFIVIVTTVLIIPSISGASYYPGAYFSKVIQTPTIGCNYAIVYGNNYSYDVFDDYTGTADGVQNGDYLYGGIQYGT